jgi:hypothetical protein
MASRIHQPTCPKLAPSTPAWITPTTSTASASQIKNPPHHLKHKHAEHPAGEAALGSPQQGSHRTLNSTGHQPLQQLHHAHHLVMAQAQHTTARINKVGFATCCVLWLRAKVPPLVPVHGLAAAARPTHGPFTNPSTPAQSCQPKQQLLPWGSPTAMLLRLCSNCFGDQ